MEAFSSKGCRSKWLLSRMMRMSHRQVFPFRMGMSVITASKWLSPCGNVGRFCALLVRAKKPPKAMVAHNRQLLFASSFRSRRANSMLTTINPIHTQGETWDRSCVSIAIPMPKASVMRSSG